jgi:hypothetical protein
VEERKKEREESWTPMQAISWTRMHRHWWVLVEMYVRRNRKDNENI